MNQLKKLDQDSESRRDFLKKVTLSTGSAAASLSFFPLNDESKILPYDKDDLKITNVETFVLGINHLGRETDHVP